MLEDDQEAGRLQGAECFAGLLEVGADASGTLLRLENV